MRSSQSEYIGFADDKPADAGRVEGDNRREIDVDILSLDVNATAGQLELHDRTNLARCDESARPRRRCLPHRTRTSSRRARSSRLFRRRTSSSTRAAGDRTSTPRCILPARLPSRSHPEPALAPSRLLFLVLKTHRISISDRPEISWISGLPPRFVIVFLVLTAPRRATNTSWDPAPARSARSGRLRAASNPARRQQPDPVGAREESLHVAIVFDAHDAIGRAQQKA